MSVEEFRKKVYQAWEQEKKETENLIKELLVELPDRDLDHSDICVHWNQKDGWSAMVEEVLEDSGYFCSYNTSTGTYVIEFDDHVKEEIDQELLEEAKLARELKRQRK